MCIDKYNQSNWNYLLLINGLNQVKHSDVNINEDLILTTNENIKKHKDYVKYTYVLDKARDDIIK